MNLTKLERKKFRIRNKIKRVSSKSRFRLSVNRSTKNISVQIIDDAKNITLVSATSNVKDIKAQKKSKKELSSIVAEQIAKNARDLVLKKLTTENFWESVHNFLGIEMPPRVHPKP